MRCWVLVIVLLPFQLYSQNMYFNAGLGVSGYAGTIHRGQTNYVLAGSAFTAESSGGLKLNRHFYLGLGVSLLDFKGLVRPYIPVFADLKVIFPGRLHPTLYLQPGYGIYKGLNLVLYDSSGNTSGHTRQVGGFFIATGVRASYKHLYLQMKYNSIDLHYDNPTTYAMLDQAYDFKNTKRFGVISLTAGVSW